MTAPRRIRMGKLIHQRKLRAPLEKRIEVHLLKDLAAIGNFCAGDDFEAIEKSLRFRAAVRFNDADHNVHAFKLPGARREEHFVGLADARRGAEKNLQAPAASILAPRFLEKRFRRGTPDSVTLRHYCQLRSLQLASVDLTIISYTSVGFLAFRSRRLL